jgi:hypothetical protein
VENVSLHRVRVSHSKGNQTNLIHRNLTQVSDFPSGTESAPPRDAGFAQFKLLTARSAHLPVGKRETWVRFRMCFFLLICLLEVVGLPSVSSAANHDSIARAKDNRGFESSPSAKPFIPWGFNYDRDYKGRLIEDYWETEWTTVEADFREMKRLGANVVRIHLQFARFMDAPDRPRIRALERLEKLLALCRHLGLYVDITGLGCYRESDVAAWYRKQLQADT